MSDIVPKPTTLPGARLVSDEQVRNWIIDLAALVKEARARTDIEKSAAKQKQWYSKLLVRYGSAKGALDCAYRLGKVDDTFHRTVSEQLIAALIVKVTEIGG